MKFYNAKEFSLNLVSKDSFIHDKIMLNNFDDFPTISVAKAFAHDIDLKFSNEDFSTIPILLGSGFFAKVYLMYHFSKDTFMAFKVPKPTESINKFFKEIILLKSLNNKNILKFYGTCLYNGTFGFLTEFLDSGSLSSLIEREGLNLEWSTRVEIAENIANGLEYLHNQFIVHRDLSAENILLNQTSSDSISEEPTVRYRAVIADFGLFLDMKHQRADRMSTVGNPFYTAPENLKNESEYNYSSDVFSFGIILCELITGLKNDPDQIPRTNNYGLDYKKLPIKRDCPKWIQDLACDCCMVYVLFRPTMTQAHQIIVDNEKYICLWYNKRTENNSSSNIFNETNQWRAMSLSVCQDNYSSKTRRITCLDIFDNQTVRDTPLLSPPIHKNGKLYRNNSVDSFLDPHFINFAKAHKDLGYVDTPLTKSMKSLDPRRKPKLSRSTDESGFHSLHRRNSSFPSLTA